MSTLKNIIEEHILYRKQIVKLAKSDLIKTYRGAALGWAWAVIKPAVTIFVYWFAFSFGLRSGGDVDGYPFFLWLIAGFLPWTYMSEMITSGAGCVRRNKHLVTKMKFPISIIPTFTSLSKFIIQFFLLILTVLIFALWGYTPTIYFLQLPIYMLMMLIFFSLWGLFSGMLSAISRDFQNLVTSFVTAIFWMSGIIYDVNKINNDVIRGILQYNPITIIANGYRNVFINHVWFFEDAGSLIRMGVLTLIMLVMAIWVYNKVYKEIPDVL